MGLFARDGFGRVGGGCSSRHLGWGMDGEVMGVWVMEQVAWYE